MSTTIGSVTLNGIGGTGFESGGDLQWLDEYDEGLTWSARSRPSA